MLFNSYPFLFAFFPAVLILYFWASRYGRIARLTAIIIASFFFYGWWNPRYLLLLTLSITMNYLIGCLLAAVSPERVRARAIWLALGVAANLLFLGIFKYFNFFAGNVNAVLGSHVPTISLILPLGISFFTFEQIGYLIDIRRGRHYHANILNYAFFVSFFPRLVAGPILRYNEIEPQVDDPRKVFSWEDLAIGLAMFAIGLCKKSLLADGIAPYVAPIFLTAASGKSVDLFMAWGGALAYTCQLYFDFSGYSDMAIGAAKCFGIRFPANFNSPYKSANIVEFWRRWHMTLSRFLRDYLYISLGGSRCGPTRHYTNLLATMLLGGLWHGANWTFAAWGSLHGIYLMFNHGWSRLGRKFSVVGRVQSSRAWPSLSYVITFVAVVIGWVFFRSPDFGSAINLLMGMAGLHGAMLPNALIPVLGPAAHLVADAGISFGEGSGRQILATYGWIVALLSIAFLMPNSQELLSRYEPTLPSEYGESFRRARIQWSLSPRWAVAHAAIALAGILSITRLSEFLYWQF